MSLRDILNERLRNYTVHQLKINRDAEERGVPCVSIDAIINKVPITMMFAKENQMTNEQMADVFVSYLRRAQRDNS